MTIVTVFTCAFSFAGCDDYVKNGSNIEVVKMVIDVYDASGEVTATTDVYLEFYLNFAPKSTAQILALIDEGYYDGTCISNINSNWMELGGYKYDDDGNLVAIDDDVDAVEGEFLNNGLKGNRLTTSKGAIIFKRDYDDNTTGDNDSKYDTAKSTMIFCFTSSASTTFDSDYYCILGMVVSDDEDEDASTELEQMSSIDKLASFADYSEEEADDNTVVTYYYEKAAEGESKYYTKWTDADGDVHYAEGTSTENDELTGTALENFNTLYEENKNYFLVVPYVKLVVQSMSRA